MNKTKYIIAAISVYLLSIASFVSKSFAFLTNNDVNLSPPVGGNILPGGQVLQSENIKDSFIFSKLIPFAIKYAIGLAVALSVIAIIAGGYQYVTAYGDEEKHKKAQHTIIYALVGLILAITAFGIVKIITSIQLT